MTADSDEARRSVVRSMQADKERKLQAQKQFYEDKIKSMRGYKKKSYTNRRQPTRRKLLSPLQVLKQREASAREIADYNRRARQARYESTRTGKFAKRTSTVGRRFLERGFVNSFYGDSYAPIKRRVSSGDLQRLRLLIALEKARRQQATQQQRFIPIQQVPVGWESVGVTRQVENEVSGFGGMNFSNAGNIAANIVGKEALGFASIQHLLPSTNVSKEADYYSHAVDINPAVQVANEVDAFAHILSPRRRIHVARR